jgi:RNA polymerase-binding transcription factor DksA
MSRSSALPTQGNPLLEQFPDYRVLLEEQWRRQVTTITELSYAALSPTLDDLDDLDDDTSRTHRLQMTARLIAAARQQLQETEAALAQLRDGSYGVCGDCGAPITRRHGDLALGTVLRRLPSSAGTAMVTEERA